MSLESRNTKPRALVGRITGPALALIGLAAHACGGGSVGPTLELRDARLIFVDQPSDAVVGALLPAVRVWVVGPDERPVPFATGRIGVGLAPNPANARLVGRLSYDLVDGEALIDEVSIAEPGDPYALTVEWNELRTHSTSFAIVDDYDAVRLSRADGRSAGLLISGSHTDGEIAELAVTTETEITTAGILRRAPSPEQNRIVAFARDRTPALLEDVPWTPGVDTLEVALRDRSRVHISVWFVHGGVDFMKSLIFQSLLDAEVMWAEERLGLAVGLVEIIDATENPAAELFRERDATAGFMDSLQVLIGERPDRINIYSLSQIRQAGATFAGVAELGGNAIAVSPGGWTGPILAHEIGHNFGLGHVDEATGFDPTNVMFSRGGTRRFFSEGQTFRIHFGAESALRAVNGLGSPIVSERLPPLGFRLWEDGREESISASIDPRLEAWLLRDCALEDAWGPSPPTLPDASALAALRIAAEQGPRPELLARIGVLAGDRFDRGRDHLRTSRPNWLSAGAFARLSVVSREGYVAGAMDRFERDYRERATELLSAATTGR